MLQQSDILRLIPLNSDQLILLSKGRHNLENSLDLDLSNLELNADSDFLEEFSNFVNDEFITMVRSHEKNFEWYTHWLIVHEELNLTIGGIGANGLPDETGQVMIGYYIDKKFEGKGFATEAVKLFLNWMTESNIVGLKVVIADTLITGLGSQKVLLKNGFEFAGTVEDGFRWQYDFQVLNCK